MIKYVKCNLAKSLNIIYVSDRKLARICALELMICNLGHCEGYTIKEDQYLEHTL